MSFYGQGGNPGVPNQAAQMVRAATSLQPQLFGQLQFQQGSQPNPFDNNHILLQSQGAPGFQNLNVSFLSEQLAAAGVNQILSQATSNASNMQTLMTPMAMTSLSFPSVPTANVTQQPGGTGQKQTGQRVFTGTVTKAHADFGFIDDEVFFTTAAVKGPILPKAGDRVLVEAEFNDSTTFKWTATRIQIVNIGGGGIGINKGNSTGSVQQQNSYQPNVSAADKTRAIQNQMVAPPPPIISLTSQAGVTTSRHTTSTSADGMNYSHVSIISNPHSVYSHSSSQQMQNVSSASTVASTVAAYQQAQAQRVLQVPVRGLIPMGAMPINSIQFNSSNSQIPSLFNAAEMNSNAATMDILRKNEKERDRMDSSDRDRDRNRDRDRERERERAKDKSRRDKARAMDCEKDKIRDIERGSVSRQYKRSPSPPPKRVKTEVHQEKPLARSDRDKEKARDGEGRKSERERCTRNPSPASSSTSASRKRSRSSSRQRNADKKETPARSVARRERSSNSKPRTKSRSRSVSSKPVARYNVVVPQYPLDMLEMSVTELKRRYQRLYIPSDFFLARACWLETFPVCKPFRLTNPSPVVLFRKHAEPIDLGYIEYDQNVQKSCTRKLQLIPEPEDARRLFSAKVMLLSSPGEPKIHNTNVRRVMNFIVGLKMGKSDLQAIGGPWSASLDGPNPQSDPQVLIRTAIRTAKASVGLDLSTCKQWYRFMELYYRRSNGVLETVVFFIPDLSTCIPSEEQWRHTVTSYGMALGEVEDQLSKKKREGKASLLQEKSVEAKELKGTSFAESINDSMVVDSPCVVEEAGKHVDDNTDTTTDVKDDEGTALKTTDVVDTPDVLSTGMETDGGLPEVTIEVEKEICSDAVVKLKIEHESEHVKENEIEPVTPTPLLADEKKSPVADIGPTQSPQIDPKQLNVVKLREELSLRGLNTKGLKAQLQSRLIEALEGEKVAAAERSVEEAMEEQEIMEVSDVADDDEVKIEPEVEVEHAVSIVSTTVDAKETQGLELSEDLKQESVNEEKHTEVTSNAKVSFPEVLVPLIPEDADEKTKEMWKRRFLLPKTPHLIVHPLQTGKTREFDCSKMCLSSIREYRVHDVKEQSFEVNLFSEFFNEMLARDFAHSIYKEAFVRTQLNISTADEEKKGKEVKKEKVNEKEEKTRKDEKGTTKEESVEDAKKKDEKETKKHGDGKKEKTEDVSSSVEEIDINKKSARSISKASSTPNNLLALAFIFYDTSRCGYIKEVDFEEICLLSGLNLTRAQVRKVTQKVFEKESQFRYNLWTENQLCVTAYDQVLNSIPSLMSDNTSLLPVFVYQKKVVDSSTRDHSELAEDTILIPLNGTIIDVRKLHDQNAKYETEQRVLETNLNALRNNLVDAQLQVADLKRSAEGWKSEYLKVKETHKTSEILLKTQSDELETLRRATERFFDRVKGVIEVKPKGQASASKEIGRANGSTIIKEIASPGSSASKKEAEPKPEAKN